MTLRFLHLDVVQKRTASFGVTAEEIDTVSVKAYETQQESKPT